MSITPEDIAASYTLFDDLELDEIIESVAYQGFEMQAMFKSLWTIVKKKPENKKMLALLIAIGLFRGIGAGKNSAILIGKSSTKGGALIKTALQTFGVKFGKPATKDEVTIPRIMICFPILTYNVFNKKPVEKLIGYKGDLPLEFRYPGSPAVMTKDEYNKQKANYIEWSVEMSKLWNKPQTPAEIEKFSDLSFANPLVPEESRVVPMY